MAINSLSNHFNLSRDYNQFRKQVLQLNPLLNNINQGKKLKLPNQNKSHLNSVEQENSRLSMQLRRSIQQQATLQRTVVQNGNKLSIYTQAAVQTQSQAQMRSQLEAHSTQLVAGTVNGKKVYLNAEKDVNQTVTENRNATATQNQNATELITRDTQKNGNVTKNTTTYETSGQGASTANTQVDRQTATETQSRTYDDKGNLKSSLYSNQVVTTDQDVDTASDWQKTGNRTVDQTVTVNNEKKGNQTIRDTNIETLDVASGNQVINTNTVNNINVQTERFDQDGNPLATTAYSQKATTNQARTIDSNRATATNQDTRTVNEPGQVETVTRTQYATNAVTVDKTDAETLYENFNAAGVLTGQRTAEADTLSTTTEKLGGESIIRSATEVKNGSNLATTDIKANTKSEVDQEILYNQDGKLTKRSIETDAIGTTNATIENRLNPSGVRIVNFDSEQTGVRETKDLTVGPANQGRLVETTTQSLQAVDGRLQFNPNAGNVGPSNGVAPGAIVIDLGANTGIRTSFKLDNGSLKFDFSAVRMTATEQVTTTGKVAPSLDGLTVEGTKAAQASGVAEEIHFRGEIISSVDEEGNRVIELKGDVTDQGIGALLVNNFQGFQMEEGKAEIDINGKLTVKRETVVDGNKTTYKSVAQAEMELNKVEEKEDLGVNVKTLTPLNTTDGFKAGLIADNNALRFNFGLFNLGISFVG